jgi:hypothetical protein
LWCQSGCPLQLLHRPVQFLLGCCCFSSHNFFSYQ